VAESKSLILSHMPALKFSCFLISDRTLITGLVAMSRQTVLNCLLIGLARKPGAMRHIHRPKDNPMGTRASATDRWKPARLDTHRRRLADLGLTDLAVLCGYGSENRRGSLAARGTGYDGAEENGDNQMPKNPLHEAPHHSSGTHYYLITP